MTLKEFRSQVRKIERRLPDRTLWPFVCDGSPLTCRIFVVGANPVRQVDEFWDFWTNARGFKRTDFIPRLEDKNGLLSRTRKYLEIVTAAAGT